jgi:DNA helicase-2/ATP-dependent DNA helicase PcrA
MMSSAATRTQRGMRERTIESQFLRELPEDGIMRSDQSDEGGYGGGFEEDDPFADRASRYRGASERDAASLRVPASGLTGSHEGDGLWMEFPVGTLVRHPSFGLGRIEQITRQRQGTRARINFSGGGSKTLILEYAKLQRVE